MTAIPQPTPAGPPPAPPARSNAAAAYDGVHDLLVLFGGTDADGHQLQDTWTFDGARWSRRPTPDTPPPAMAGEMTFDGASGKVTLFAGPGQTWTWDGERWRREQPVHQPPRLGQLVYDPSLGVVVLLAPSPVTGTHTWGWNGNDWYPINEAANPDPNGLIGLTYDVRGARLIGVGDGTWAFIGSRWTRLGDLPYGLPQANLAITSSHVINAPVLFGGGANDGSGLTSVLWTWDGKAWQKRDAGVGPDPRRNAVLVDDEKRQQLVLFGGIGPSGTLGDTWTWTPDKGWSRVG